MKIFIYILIAALANNLFARELYKEVSRAVWNEMTDTEKSNHWSALTNEWRIQAEEVELFHKAQELGICHIHTNQMIRRIIEIKYGLPTKQDLDYTPPPIGYVIDHFPHADREFENGGCMIMPDRPKSKIIFVCPKCTELQTEWIKNHLVPNKATESTP